MKNFLKKFTFVLALLVISSSITFAGAFPDVAEDHDNYKAIEYLKEKGFVGGYSDLTFKPENKITRAESVKIIVSALGLVLETAKSPSLKPIKYDFSIRSSEKSYFLYFIRA